MTDPQTTLPDDYAVPAFDSRVFLIYPEVYRATRNNDLMYDITEHVLDISIDADIDRTGAKGEVSLTLDDVDVVDESHWVAPFLNIHREDGSVQRSQMGLYILDQPTVTYESTHAQSVEVRGQDIVRLLEQSIMTEPEAMPHVSDVISEVRRAVEAGTAVRSANLIEDPEFDEGTTGWWRWSTPVASAGVLVTNGGMADGPCYFVSQNGAGSGTVKFVHEIGIDRGVQDIYFGAWAYIDNLRVDAVSIQAAWVDELGGTVVGNDMVKEVTSWMPGWVHIGGTIPSHAQAGAVRIELCFDTNSGQIGDGVYWMIPEIRYEYMPPITRHAFPSLDRKTGSNATTDHIAHPANTTWLKRINDLLQSIGCHAVYARLDDGRLTTSPLRSTQNTTPSRSYSVDGETNILAPFEVSRTPGTIYNTVVVVKEDYESETTLVAVAENTDISHPWSVQNRGRIAPSDPVMVSDAVDMEALQAIADDKLARSSVPEGLMMSVLPDPDLLVHDVIEVTGTDARYAGRWAIERIRWGMHAMDPLVEVSARRTYGKQSPWSPE